MKKNDTLTIKKLNPKQTTIDFLLNFSKSLEIIKTNDVKSIKIIKN